jgi:uncharacterized protein YlbG (UPF0298 family)
MMGMDHRLLSRPVRLHWAGWTADTYSLQQAGWSISANQDVYRQSMALALRHDQAGMVGMTANVTWDFMQDSRSAYFMDNPHDLPVRLMARKVEVMHTRGDEMMQYRPIDALPQLVTSERRSLEDFIHFAPAMTRTQQLIVPEETVDDLMQRIMDMQHTKRVERLRQELGEGERVSFQDRQKFHAQIISLAA